MSVTTIDHVLVLSDDIDGARDFYCAALGLAPGDRPPLEFAGHWLYAAGAPRLHIADRAQYTAHAERIGLPSPGAGAATPAIDHIAFAAADYGEAEARLERAGVVALRNAVPAAGLRQLFFAAPDGVRIEINVVERGRA
jgi:catechol 2,3-dioxygenase-like lactoylglutathione lyase family enzyme